MQKPIWKYFLIFVFFFISLVFIFTLSRGDTFVNFGFSYAISKGEIPYKDFNMVITPLAPILYSFGLFFCKNIIIYYLEQAFLLTIFYYFISKLLDRKSILYLLFMILPYPIALVSTIFPGYNFLMLLLFILFVYCFKNKDNDYLLGIILGLIFCTKQTIGVLLFIPTFYYLFKKKEKFFKIFYGYLIPCFILLIYLFITNSFKQFVDLCFLGLFDFSNSNHQFDSFYLILFVIGFIYFIIRIYKEKNNLLLYYGLLFGFVVVPIMDYYHVSLFLMIVFYFVLENINIDDKYYKYIILSILFICGIWSFVTCKYFDRPVLANYNNFSFVMNHKSYVDTSKELLDYVDHLDRRVIYFMRGSENCFYKIIHNEKLDYFDFPNYGNYGYDGISKMKEKIDSLENVYFVVDRELIYNKDKGQQYIKELGVYIIQHGDKINSIGPYDIYIKIKE